MYKVIVVDDEPAAVNLISNIIKKKCTSFEVSEVAYNGQAALEKIYDNEPDLVLTDVRMPGMDGIKLLKHIRERFPELSVIILSGYSEFEYAKSAISYGVEDYILKPLDIPEFLEMMKKVQEKLDKKFYRVRNQLVSTMINGEQKLTENIIWQCGGIMGYPEDFILEKKKSFLKIPLLLCMAEMKWKGLFYVRNLLL